jgi:hypothetical protein
MNNRWLTLRTGRGYATSTQLKHAGAARYQAMISDAQRKRVGEAHMACASPDLRRIPPPRLGASRLTLGGARE